MSNPPLLSLPDVPDVLYAIFSYLDPVHQTQYDQVYESRRSLALVARTCRGFAGPALDVLWKRLPDDQPLADLLCEVGIATRQEGEDDFQLLGENKPGRYWFPNQDARGLPVPGTAEAYERKWRLSRGYGIQYLFRRDIGDPRKHPSWPRFAAYASRVRAITLFAFDGPAWCGIWEELRSRTGNVPILPNLLSVAFCRKSWAALTPGALALISPSVCNLNFNLGNENEWPVLDEKLRFLFSQCFNTAPKIDQLRLELPPSRFGAPLLQIHCSRIRRLEVYPQIDLESLRILTGLPALQHLSISLVRRDLPDGNTSFKLTSVATFVVEGTWLNLSTLLNSVRLPSMHALSVTGWAYGEPAAELAQGATQCFKTISARQTSITSLSVSASSGRMPPRRGCVMRRIPLVKDTFEAPFLDIVGPLLSLSALRHLSLWLPGYFDLECTAADLRAVAESFPAIETLHLRILSHSYGTPREGAPERPRGGPLEALVHFARNCPRLRLLHLPAMEMAEGSPPLPELGDFEPHALQTLIIPKVLVPPGRVDLAGKVSEIVQGVFPLAASPFRLQRLTMEGNWAIVDGASECPECSSWKISTFS
ncbi:hypothetical protein V8D89_015677 [Ganoderma adspersum]